MSSSTHTDRAPVRCQTCGDVIGVYEPVVVLEPPGRRETSLAAEPELRDSAPVCHHRACADDLDDSHALAGRSEKRASDRGAPGTGRVE
jgi:hypothetical protein